MFDYSKIEDVILQYKDCPDALKVDCITKGISNFNFIHAIKIGNTFLNSFGYDEKIVYKYSYKDICVALTPRTIYDFTFCVTLYNSQAFDQSAIEKAFHSVRNDAPADYDYLLKETNGWVLWDYQFTNIIRLYTSERDLPGKVHLAYRRDRLNAIKLCKGWLMDGKNIIESIEENMMQIHSVFRFVLKSGKQAFYSLHE